MKEIDNRKPVDRDIIEDVPARPIIGGAADEPKAKSTHSWWGIAAVAGLLVIAAFMIIL